MNAPNKSNCLPAKKKKICCLLEERMKSSTQKRREWFGTKKEQREKALHCLTLDGMKNKNWVVTKAEKKKRMRGRKKKNFKHRKKKQCVKNLLNIFLFLLFIFLSIILFFHILFPHNPHFVLKMKCDILFFPATHTHTHPHTYISLCIDVNESGTDQKKKENFLNIFFLHVQKIWKSFFFSLPTKAHPYIVIVG